MRRRDPVLRSADVQQGGGQIDLFPPQANELRHPEAMPIGQKEERRIPGAVPARLSGGLDEPFGLGRGEILPGARLAVGTPPRRKRLFHNRDLGEDSRPFQANFPI